VQGQKIATQNVEATDILTANFVRVMQFRAALNVVPLCSSRLAQTLAFDQEDRHEQLSQA
jgi:hypothetical protein